MGLPVPAMPTAPPPIGLPLAVSNQAQAMGSFGEIDGDLPAAHALGLSFLLPSAGAIIGYKVGGLWGSAAGTLVGGAAVNGIHAAYFLRTKTPEAKHQAMVSGVYAALGLGFAGWILLDKAKGAAK